MAKYRDALPQLKDGLFITDAGLETVLIFHQGMDLPLFAAFPLLNDAKGRETLFQYYSTYARLAVEHKAGLVLESVTWRASSGWADQLGYSSEALAKINYQAIELLSKVRDTYENEKSPMVISGCIGPRGDGYSPSHIMNEETARDYHSVQIESFVKTDADFVSAFTMNYLEEALGIVQAAKEAAMPVVISFTVETDGKLPSGLSLKEAITEVDERTNNGPAYYMLNCAHPTHFSDVLKDQEPWIKRIRGLRSNASKMSHAELDNAEELDDGNPKEFGAQYKELLGLLDQINVVGGCCGTDERHIEEICKAFAP
ncbi:MAG: homocysteine S-methyltransferase family protein [Thermodesulfobacteriota bacterium]